MRINYFFKENRILFISLLYIQVSLMKVIFQLQSILEQYKRNIIRALFENNFQLTGTHLQRFAILSFISCSRFPHSFVCFYLYFPSLIYFEWHWTKPSNAISQITRIDRGAFVRQIAMRFNLIYSRIDLSRDARNLDDIALNLNRQPRNIQLLAT